MGIFDRAKDADDHHREQVDQGPPQALDPGGEPSDGPELGSQGAEALPADATESEPPEAGESDRATEL